MFQIGDTVIVRRTGELLQVKEVKTWDGKVLCICGRVGGDDSQSFSEEEIVDPFPGMGRSSFPQT